MSWKDVSLMSLRLEFVTLAAVEGANVRELCRRYGVSPKTAYKWIARHRESGAGALADRSRRPATSPDRCPEALEAAVLRLRDQSLLDQLEGVAEGQLRCIDRAVRQIGLAR